MRASAPVETLTASQRQVDEPPESPEGLHRSPIGEGVISEVDQAEALAGTEFWGDESQGVVVEAELCEVRERAEVAWDRGDAIVACTELLQCGKLRGSGDVFQHVVTADECRQSVQMPNMLKAHKPIIVQQKCAEGAAMWGEGG